MTHLDRSVYSTSLYPECLVQALARSLGTLSWQALSAYRVGEADFMTLVESQMTVNRYAIERIRLAADYLTARAEVEALLGGPGALP